MPLYLKVVGTEWKSSTHDKRELRVAMELGYETLVVATSKCGKTVFEDRDEEFKVIRIPTRRFGTGRFAIILGRIWAIILFIRVINGLNAQIISGHNYEGWLFGYLGRKKNYTKLIYDSHEFELFQNGSTAFRRIIIRQIETFIFKHTDLCYTVTDSIAEELRRIYKLKKKPLVVRNIPEKYEVNTSNVERIRENYFQSLDINQDGIILMYHGGFTSGRGIEQAIEAVSKSNNTGLVLLGFFLDSSYEDYLYRLIEDSGCKNRICIKPAVHLSELYEYVAAADLGIVLSRNTCLNHYYSLPNKLFENIQSLTPVVASDFPEISRIVNGYGVGETIDPDDIQGLIKMARKLQDDSRYNNWLKYNLLEARELLNWQNEKDILKKAIAEL